MNISCTIRGVPRIELNVGRRDPSQRQDLAHAHACHERAEDRAEQHCECCYDKGVYYALFKKAVVADDEFSDCFKKRRILMGTPPRSRFTWASPPKLAKPVVRFLLYISLHAEGCRECDCLVVGCLVAAVGGDFIDDLVHCCDQSPRCPSR